MSPITLPRMQSVRAEEKQRGAEASVSRSSRGEAGVSATAPGQGKDERPIATRGRQALPALVGLLLVPLASAATRHWLIEAGATLCVAGGFIAAPFLTVTAWIGLALPPRMPLHQASTALFLVAILWMAAALIGAHLHHNRRTARATGHAEDGE